MESAGKRLRTRTDIGKDIERWPYPASFSMEDLEDKIIKYDHEIAKKRILNHHIKLGICESGMASEIVGKEIVKLCRYQ